jgi:hypothetical protein
VAGIPVAQQQPVAGCPMRQGQGVAPCAMAQQRPQCAAGKCG